MKPGCPVCGHKETNYFHKRNFYPYFQCPECGLVFLSPIPSEKKIASLYDKHYEFKVDKKAEARFVEQSNVILKMIKKYAPMSTTLLDIGAGYGTFVKLAKQNGFSATGVEPAKNLFKTAKNNKLKVLNTDFEKYFQQNPKAKFDAISLIHVIEHVRDPEKSLRKIISRIKKDGILFIETPNADSHLLNVEGPDYTFLTPPEHIHLFSPKSLEVLIRMLGRDVTIHTNTYSYPEHFVGIIRRIKNGEIGKVSKKQAVKANKNGKNGKNGHKTVKPGPAPYFDTNIAPALTPLLNLANKGSILQMYIQVK